MENLAKLTPFEFWFVNVIVEDLVASEEVVGDVISINSPPLDLASGYRSMYAFGNCL
jgi:hypothetical protein